jgi:hypothetical protein
VRVRRLLVVGAIVMGAGTATAFAATLTVGSWHLWAGSQTLTKGTCTLSGTATSTDTYVDEFSPTSSFGGSTTLLVGPKSNKRNWAFVRFDLSSCGIPSTGGADSATLTVHITAAPGSSRTIDVDSVGTSWSGSSTWNNAQTFSYGSVAGSFATGTTSNVNKSVTVTADVDALIKNGTANYGWRLADNGASTNVTTTFGAAGNGTAANRPQLVINYEK